MPRKWLGPHPFADCSLPDSRLICLPYNSSTPGVLHIVTQGIPDQELVITGHQMIQRSGGVKRLLISKAAREELRNASGEKTQ